MSSDALSAAQFGAARVTAPTESRTFSADGTRKAKPNARASHLRSENHKLGICDGRCISGDL